MRLMDMPGTGKDWSKRNLTIANHLMSAFQPFLLPLGLMDTFWVEGKYT